MKTINVAASRQYNIHIGPGLLALTCSKVHEEIW